MAHATSGPKTLYCYVVPNPETALAACGPGWCMVDFSRDCAVAPGSWRVRGCYLFFICSG